MTEELNNKKAEIVEKKQFDMFELYQERCEDCENPPGTRCESNPSGCLFKKPISE